VSLEDAPGMNRKLTNRWSSQALRSSVVFSEITISRTTMNAINPESAVRQRYAAAAQAPVAALCCAVDYEPQHLKSSRTKSFKRIMAAATQAVT